MDVSFVGNYFAEQPFQVASSIVKSFDVEGGQLLNDESESSDLHCRIQNEVVHHEIGAFICLRHLLVWIEIINQESK